MIQARDGSIAVSARTAGGLFDLSPRSWWRLHSAGTVPAPAGRVGRSVRWDRDELRAWWQAGCPSRSRWEQMRATVYQTGSGCSDSP